MCDRQAPQAPAPFWRERALLRAGVAFAAVHLVAYLFGEVSPWMQDWKTGVGLAAAVVAIFTTRRRWV